MRLSQRVSRNLNAVGDLDIDKSQQRREDQPDGRRGMPGGRDVPDLGAQQAQATIQFIAQERRHQLGHFVGRMPPGGHPVAPGNETQDDPQILCGRCGLAFRQSRSDDGQQLVKCTVGTNHMLAEQLYEFNKIMKLRQLIEEGATPKEATEKVGMPLTTFRKYKSVILDRTKTRREFYLAAEQIRTSQASGDHFGRSRANSTLTSSTQPQQNLEESIQKRSRQPPI
ncbi:MAG: hypothetical protein H7Y60_03420 [Rhodospirillaceae bacterium]|nr:hypothetical protein [Rhodospirillales bacterium]